MCQDAGLMTRNRSKSLYGTAGVSGSSPAASKIEIKEDTTASHIIPLQPSDGCQVLSDLRANLSGSSDDYNVKSSGSNEENTPEPESKKRSCHEMINNSTTLLSNGSHRRIPKKIPTAVNPEQDLKLASKTVSHTGTNSQSNSRDHRDDRELKKRRDSWDTRSPCPRRSPDRRMYPSPRAFTRPELLVDLTKDHETISLVSEVTQELPLASPNRRPQSLSGRPDNPMYMRLFRDSYLIQAQFTQHWKKADLPVRSHRKGDFSPIPLFSPARRWEAGLRVVTRLPCR